MAKKQLDPETPENRLQVICMNESDYLSYQQQRAAGGVGMPLGRDSTTHGFSFSVRVSRWKRFHWLGRCWRWKGKGSAGRPPPKKQGQQWGVNTSYIMAWRWTFCRYSRGWDFPEFSCWPTRVKTVGEDLGEPLLADLYGSLLRMELKGISDIPRPDLSSMIQREPNS